MKTPHLFLVPCSLFLALAALAGLSASAAPAPDLAALAAAVQSNIVAKIEAATAVRKSAVRELLTTNSYQILTSTKLSDAVAKLALQKQLADAALEDFLSTEDGRFRCHGRYVGQTVDLASQTATFTHADGTTYSVKFAAPNLSASVAAANKRLPAAPMTNGIPARLVAARLRRYEEKLVGTNYVSQVETATKGDRPNN